MPQYEHTHDMFHLDMTLVNSWDLSYIQTKTSTNDSAIQPDMDKTAKK